ncbi:putative PLAC8 family [Leishmania naiffi]|uniref:PLAC8 family n=1 Tax=Leishmania naiffi TaxID=5678 RepID=A0AAW3C7N5_9TRYP
MSKPDLAKDAQAPLPAMVLRFGDDVGDASYPEAALVVEGIAAPCKAEAKKVSTDRDDNATSTECAPPHAQHCHQPPRHDFRSGLFDCHESWAVCLDACLCTYCVASAHHNFLMNDTAGVYFPACCGLLCVDAGLSALSSCLPSSLYLHTYLMRSAIRQRYGLHSADGRVDSDEHDSGSYRVCSTESLLDLLAVSLCLTCVIAQHQREIMHQGDWCGGVFSSRSSLQAPATVHTV